MSERSFGFFNSSGFSTWRSGGKEYLLTDQERGDEQIGGDAVSDIIRSFITAGGPINLGEGRVMMKEPQAHANASFSPLFCSLAFFPWNEALNSCILISMVALTRLPRWFLFVALGASFEALPTTLAGIRRARDEISSSCWGFRKIVGTRGGPRRAFARDQ